MIVGAHQVNLLPFSGFLKKLRACDRFVLLTHCQYERHNYQNRFNLDGKWYTMSVSQHLEPLAAKVYNAPAADWARIKRRLPQYAEILSRFDDCIGPSLVETNVAIIRRLCALLGIGTEIVMDYPTDLTSTARLVDLCRHCGATTYLSGPSGRKYLDVAQFEAAGIDVRFQDAEAVPRAAVEVVAVQCHTERRERARQLVERVYPEHRDHEGTGFGSNVHGLRETDGHWWIDCPCGAKIRVLELERTAR